ncbi:hypothetical protein J433_05225 [Corynebacterium glutamicum MT]|uniref:Uncharacterized protein n=1 Tax=Corynebacterium glutamicum TaxID=1718 RepID=A0AB36ILA4_CORGT|nr:hypothetical protein C624_08425 [Corynebacterium glutamicum SCgG1]AGN22285.1 hypothetical protein C629_08435 [Corynebacterium glutamicum SCgG2]EGV40693.1 hypothetical protein CgS9114_06835 [Corynebacterium glutamicum S9114]EOA65248.1 hypothetical protein J433_05225 [Corynebacterium glutamicum MT]EPP40744.1 hypothetical protein A583_07950 [Corynebacterium glutamicum Z188]OKX80761.1 hypothetical protein AUP70_03645 [Corynebacterium glutamicum]
MVNQAVGALKGTTEPIIMGNLVPDMDPELYGPQTLQDLLDASTGTAIGSIIFRNFNIIASNPRNRSSSGNEDFGF